MFKPEPSLHDPNPQAREAFPLLLFRVEGCVGNIKRRAIGLLHWHDDLQVVLVHAGHADIDCSGERLVCQAGQAVLFNSGAPHRIGATGDCAYDSLLFPPRVLGFFAGSEMSIHCVEPYVGSGAQPFCLLDGTEGWHGKALRELSRTCDILRASTDARQRYLACSHLVQAWGVYVTGVQQVLPSDAQRLADDRLKKCSAFVDAHYAERVSLSDIAAAADIGTSECSRVFRRCLQTSPYAHLTDVRLSHAVALMQEGGLTLSDIAHATGFGSSSHFSNAFRKAFGTSPSAYLTELRQG